MIMFAVWTSTVGMLICSCCLGFFSATVGPSLAEVGCLICGQELFNFGHGYIMVAHGAGWLLGAPAAGGCFSLQYSSSFSCAVQNPIVPILLARGFILCHFVPLILKFPANLL